MRYWDPDLYNQVIWFAAHAHKEQKMPGQNISYLLHLNQVCQEALGAVIANSELNGNLVMCCALLHDTIEDTDCSYDEIVQAFGKTVADGVLALSKRKMKDGQPQDKPAQMKDSLQRIQQQPHEVWVVKLADRITNLQKPPHYWSIEKINRYHDEAIQILEALGAASPYLQKRFQQKLDGYKQFFT